ncbi:hypothetical protein G5X33_001025 [Salmonella enterica]|nr:hypothetical protein [Salmonella enterica]
MHQSTVTSLLFGSPLCERGDDLGTEQWALAGNGLINFELAANQERSNPSNDNLSITNNCPERMGQYHCTVA